MKSTECTEIEQRKNYELSHIFAQPSFKRLMQLRSRALSSMGWRYHL